MSTACREIFVLSGPPDMDLILKQLRLYDDTDSILPAKTELPSLCR
jgi:hypothetical protein